MIIAIAMKRTDEERRWIKRETQKNQSAMIFKNKIVKVIHHRVLQQFFSYANDDADDVDIA